MRHGTLYIISAPSGAGKTSLVKALLADSPNVAVSVSHTTRAPRAGEVDGIDYHFVDMAQFTTMRDQQAFLEHAEVYGNCYGTSRAHVDELRHAGQDVILEIDWQGAQQIRKICPTAISVYILPPSLAALSQRLSNRNQDSAAVIQRRLDAARQDISHYNEYDYVVVNDELTSASADLASIFRSQRLKLAQQQTYYTHLVDQLIN